MSTGLNIEKYKSLLDRGSFDGLRGEFPDKSRYHSFKKCLELIKERKNPEILELGTSRSFVDGRYEGCNSDDTKYWDPIDYKKWDWGAGCFTLLFGMNGLGNITTVDLIDNHIRRCKIMTDSLGIKNCTHVVSDSVTFLRTTQKKFDVIYLDTGDMWPINSTCDLQLMEVKEIIKRDLLKKGGIILIDDVLNGTPREMGDLSNTLGKSEKSIPFLLENGYTKDYTGYQYILIK